jgi:hypothetical protein
MVWELPGAGPVDPRFMVFGNPLTEIPVTFRQFTRSLDEAFRHLSRMVE